MSNELVKVNCWGCGKPFFRNIEKKYIRPDGTLTVSSYCKACQQPKRKKYRGKTTTEILDERTLEKYGVKILSQEEINELKPLYENRRIL